MSPTEEKTNRRIESLRSILKMNHLSTVKELSRISSIPERTIYTYMKKYGLRKELQNEDISPKIESKILTTSAELSLWKSKYRQALETISDQEKLISSLVSLPKMPERIPITARHQERREVVPVIVASDWHIEETVTREITNGKNEYNLEIAENSIRQFFSNAIYMINREKMDTDVHTVVLALLGDLINGTLREEDLQNNSITPVEALSLVRSLIFSGIEKMQKETGCTIKVICTVGNHGRLTDKIFPSNQVHLSMEYLLYKLLESDFKRNKNIDVKVSESYYFMQNILGLNIRFHHGHIFKFNGGIGGLSIPVQRKIAQMNLTEHADMDVCGHFHSTQIFPNALLNGSLVGTNGYSMSLGIPHEPPRQLFFLIDSKYGRSEVSPIFIDR